MSSTETGSMASKEQIVSLGWASYKAAAVLVSLVLVMVIIIMIMLIVFYQVSPNQAVVNPIIIDPTTDPLATLDDLGTLWLNTTGDNSAGVKSIYLTHNTSYIFSSVWILKKEMLFISLVVYLGKYLIRFFNNNNSNQYEWKFKSPCLSIC